MSATCGYRVPASDAIDERLFCSSCGFLSRLVVQTACGHLYCEKCLAEVMKKKTKTCTAKCGALLEQSQSFPDNFIRREIDNMHVHCINAAAGCTWSGEVKLTDDHQSSCRYRPMHCGNDGCTSVVPACNLAFHEQDCCHHREVCQYCHSEVTMKSLQDHLENCGDVPVSCDKCGKANIPRGQLNLHLDPFSGDCDCDDYCPFRAHGCSRDGIMSREATTNHLKESFNPHLFRLVHLLEQSRHESREGAPSEDSIRGDLDSKVNALVGVVGGLEQESNPEQVSNTAQLQENVALKNRVECLEATVKRQDATIDALFRLLRHSTGGHH